MANPFGFLTYSRKNNPYRPVKERLEDWKELQIPLSQNERQEQAARCMNCGVPFCHSGELYGGGRAVSGCPNDNLIPEWNDLVYKGDFKRAWERLSRTNPLPEMTGRVCPAPCEKGCTEYLNGVGVTIHDNERFIIDTAFDNDWVKNTGLPAGKRSPFKIAIVGSGPAGLSAAWRLNQLGHNVTVYERSNRFGGLLMYGIPNMKLDKDIIERRIDVMKAVGITFINNTEIGSDITVDELYADYDRIILCIGASVPRDLDNEGRHLNGIHFAVEYLTEATKSLLENDKDKPTSVLEGKHVVVIGGGDTGNDCIATVLRQGCASVKQLEITPEPPTSRPESNPWPQYPFVKSLGYGQEEALTKSDEQLTYYERTATSFIGAERHQLIGVKTVKVDSKFQEIPGSEETLQADLVLLAMGFTGPEKSIFDAFHISEILDDYSTNNERVFVAGDAKRGPSLVIWAIREGRKAAEHCNDILQSVTVTH